MIEKLAEIERLVNIPKYDDLNDYLRGVRDMINFLNNAEYATSDEVFEFIKSELEALNG